MFAGLMSHAGAATAVELVEALVLGGLDGLSALVTDRGERDLGHDGVGLDDKAADDDGGRGFHDAWRWRAGHHAGGGRLKPCAVCGGTSGVGLEEVGMLGIGDRR